MSWATPMVLFGDQVDLCLSSMGGEGGSSAKENLQILDLQRLVSTNICWMKKQNGIQNN